MRAPMPEDLLAREGCSLGVQNLRVSMLVIRRTNDRLFGLITVHASFVTSSMTRASGGCLGTERR
jgi:hypothetical protein